MGPAVAGGVSGHQDAPASPGKDGMDQGTPRAGFQAWIGVSPAPGTAVLAPSRHQASSAGPQHSTELQQDLPAACRETRIKFGKGQGDLEVLEKGLIIPIAP